MLRAYVIYRSMFCANFYLLYLIGAATKGSKVTGAFIKMMNLYEMMFFYLMTW